MKEIIIDMDDREIGMEEIALMVDSSLTLQKKRLDVGDYAFGNLIVERKTIDDFCHSVLDERLEGQVERMKREQDSGKKCFIILVGSIKERTVNLNENCIIGKLCSLVYKHNIAVIQVDDEFQFVYCLKNLYEKYKKGGVKK